MHEQKSGLIWFSCLRKSYIQYNVSKVLFSCSVHVGDNKHGHVSINDTSVAWTALRESANRDRRDVLAYEHRRDSGRLKQLGDVLRFLRRASKEAETLKATEEFLPYDEQYRVSDQK